MNIQWQVKGPKKLFKSVLILGKLRNASRAFNIGEGDEAKG